LKRMVFTNDKDGFNKLLNYVEAVSRPSLYSQLNPMLSSR
jgi:hypothetical protein